LIKRKKRKRKKKPKYSANMDKYIVSCLDRLSSIDFYIVKFTDYKIDENLGIDTFAERILVKKQDENETFLLSKVRSIVFYL